MRIRYQSAHGLATTRVSAIRDPEWSVWANGQERDVPDDLRVAVVPYPGRPPRDTRVVDALLTAGPEFVDASTGLNPDYTCAVCGKATTDVGFAAVNPATGDVVFHEYHDGSEAEGNWRRLCQRDYLAAHPQWIEDHASREGIDLDMIAQARVARDAGAPPTTQQQIAAIVERPGGAARDVSTDTAQSRDERANGSE